MPTMPDRSLTDNAGDSVDEVGGGQGNAALSQRQKNGVQVNGKLPPKSAAQRKREKRKQKKREGSVISEAASDAETVLILVS